MGREGLASEMSRGLADVGGLEFCDSALVLTIPQQIVVDLGGNGETRQWEVGWCDG